MSYSVGCRCGSDSTLLWLWCSYSSYSSNSPSSWEPPHAVGVALKRQKTKKIKNKTDNFNFKEVTSEFLSWLSG